MSSSDPIRHRPQPELDSRPFPKAVPNDPRARVVRELHELIAALDRRVPQVQRVGERAIADAAAALRDEALKRIEEIERDATRAKEGNSRTGASHASE